MGIISGILCHPLQILENRVMLYYCQPPFARSSVDEYLLPCRVQGTGYPGGLVVLFKGMLMNIFLKIVS